MASAPSPARDPYESNSPAVLHLSARAWDDSYHPLDVLARSFMLTVYGTAGMSKRTRYEIRIAALMLGIVACFELMAWTFVFYQFGSQGEWGLLPVVCAALLVAAAMTMLERSILVSDVDVKGQDYIAVWLKILFRLAIILIVALRITSQPVELVAFRQSIDARTFQEDVRRNLASAATSTINGLQELQTRFDVLTSLNDESSQSDPRKLVLISKLRIEQDQKKIGDNNQRILSWRERIVTASSELAMARRRLSHFSEELLRVNSSGALQERTGAEAEAHSGVAREESEIRRLNAEIARLRSNIESTSGLISQLENEESQTQFVLNQATGNSATSDTNLGSIPTVKDFDELFDNFKAYAAVLLDAKSPKDIKTRSPFQFVQKDYTDLERLVVVDDLRSGLPPFEIKLARSSPERNAKNSATRNNSEDLKLFDRNVAKVVQVFDQYSAQLRSEGVEDARRTQIIAIGKYWMILGVAIVIPMVALIYKVTSGKELKNYYSVEFQAASFNPEALFQATTEDFLQNEKRRKNT